MDKKAQKSVTKARYDSTHPTISIRVDRPFFDRLTEMQEMTGQSVKELLQIALDQTQTDVGNAYQQGYDKGYEEGQESVVTEVRSMEFTPKCPRCGYAFGIHLRLEERD